ncbi:penicillin-binding protein activator [Roseibium aquae]|uniref:Penicillin-binding protein activator n=2 Tax=Roseibium aquae TaxID=1323746 RepID=A0A916WYN5_9HYPH|nr:penicillin-binding protein activator [Roseibium aquae]
MIMEGRVQGILGRETLKKLARGAVLGLGAAVLAACQGSSLGSLPGTQINPTGQPAVSGDVIGTGSVRVGLLLPLSGGGSATSIATVFRNSAELALSSFPNADVQLLVKDTGGTSQGGRAAAQSAIAEGAEFLLGPVFAPAVSGAASSARASGVPMVAFSTDTSVAARGVYLLSFLPASDVKRIVGYASSQGRRSFAALLPDNTYGSVVEAAFRQEVGRTGGRIVSIQRYAAEGTDTADLVSKTQAIASALGQADTLFVPAGGGVPPLVLQTLISAGAPLGNIKMIGSGQWDTPQLKNNQVMAGSWFPGPEENGFQTFAQRYQATYGSAPPRNATLAYDGVTLAAGLVRSAGQQRFSIPVLTNQDGFIGIDGLFRFLSNGQNERGLAVYQITGSGAQAVSPAPRDFRSGS